MSDLVIEELLHGEPVQCLVGTPADVGVVDIRADYHTDPVPATPVDTDTHTHRLLRAIGHRSSITAQRSLLLDQHYSMCMGTVNVFLKYIICISFRRKTASVLDRKQLRAKFNNHRIYLALNNVSGTLLRRSTFNFRDTARSGREFRELISVHDHRENIRRILTAVTTD